MRPVVDADRTTLGRALLHKIDSHAVPAAHNLRGIHTKDPQAVNRRLADRMIRQFRHKGHIHAIIGQRHRHICLPAAKRCLHLVILEKAQIPVRSQPQHNLTKSHNLSHNSSLFSGLRHDLA